MNLDLTEAAKARIYDQNAAYEEQLKNAPYQLFLVNDEGRWNPILAQQCVPELFEELAHEVYAIIDRQPHKVEIKSEGSSFIPFAEGDDGETEYSYSLIAKGIQVGTSFRREY